MFVVFLRLTEDKAKAAEFMDGHNAWIQQGFDDGVFLIVGGLQPVPGGGIVAHNLTREELEKRVSEDPFVIENVASVEIIEISPAKTDERLSFLSK